MHEVQSWSYRFIDKNVDNVLSITKKNVPYQNEGLSVEYNLFTDILAQFQGL